MLGLGYQIDKERLRSLNLLDRVWQEIDIHRQLSHPGIVQLLDCFEDVRRIYMVLELCSGGELAQILQQKQLVFDI